MNDYLKLCDMRRGAKNTFEVSYWLDDFAQQPPINMLTTIQDTSA